MKKNHEVEYRALLTPKVYLNLLEIGKKKHALNINDPIIIEDSYYCSKEVTSFKEVEMDTVGSYSFRLRKEIKNNKEISKLNTKIITTLGDHNAWREHETDVSSHDECDKILKSIGFKRFFTFKKKRYTYYVKDILVCLEDIKGFGPIIEVEIITTKEKEKDAKKKLITFLKSHNIKREDIVKKSVTNMLMKKKASF